LSDYASRMKKTQRYIMDNLQFLIARIAVENGEVHAYGIERDIFKDFGTSPCHSKVYPKLDSMARDGYLTQPENTIVNGRKRKTFKPTQKAVDMIKEFEEVSRLKIEAAKKMGHENASSF
jgi:DNA-binding PadR family transcriptional regulator